MFSQADSFFSKARWVLLLVLGLSALGWRQLSAASESDWRVSAKETRDAVHAVVEAQLAALRAGNFKAAYALASREIRARFDERLFAAMMRRGYAPLLRVSQPDLGVVRDQQGERAQMTVSLPDGYGRTIVYRYWLVKESDGWRIHGVTVEQLPARGDA